MILRQVLRPNDVEVEAFRFGETSCGILQNTETPKKLGRRTSIGTFVARIARVVRGVHRKSRRRWSVKEHNLKHFSSFIFGPSYKSGVNEVKSSCSLPEFAKYDREPR